jgi:integrase
LSSEWYLPFYKRKWKESTAMTNEDRVDHHIVTEFGNHDLQRFLDSKSSLSFSTVDHLRWDLKQMFDMAVAEGIVRRHPALILFTPRQCARPEHPTLSLKEVKQIFDALNLRERLIVKLAVLAGMRPGEIFGLKRGRIDAGSVAIEQRVYRGIIDTPKTQKSKRLAALSSGLCRDLDAWLNRDPDGKAEDWVFPSEKLTTPLAKDNAMLRYIRPALKTIGFDWVDFHVLRRTHSSLMRELGVDPKVVADQQGHTLDVNLNITEKPDRGGRATRIRVCELMFP